MRISRSLLFWFLRRTALPLSDRPLWVSRLFGIFLSEPICFVVGFTSDLAPSPVTTLMPVSCSLVQLVVEGSKVGLPVPMIGPHDSVRVMSTITVIYLSPFLVTGLVNADVHEPVMPFGTLRLDVI